MTTICFSRAGSMLERARLNRALVPALLSLCGLSFDQVVVLRAGLDMVLHNARLARFH